VSREHTWFPWRYCIIARKPASFANGTVETTMEEVNNVVQHKIESKLVIRTQCGVYGIYKPLRPLVALLLHLAATALAFVVYIISIDFTSCPYNYYL